ncbi:MAG: hypothetical protein CL707_08475 [Chloroflexi bacterium]|nr:hypothetical protein [Chloroflexota bacterium]
MKDFEAKSSEKDWKPPKFEDVKIISQQIQDQETPSKKQARDKNLLRKSFEESKKMHGKRLYPYKLDFVEFFQDVKEILKSKPPSSPAELAKRGRKYTH